jgi:hypothetical protein
MHVGEETLSVPGHKVVWSIVLASYEKALELGTG